MSTSIALLLTYADGDQTFTHFNGDKDEAIKFYGANNSLLPTGSYAKVHAIHFQENDDAHTFPLESKKRPMRVGTPT